MIDSDGVRLTKYILSARVRAWAANRLDTKLELDDFGGIAEHERKACSLALRIPLWRVSWDPYRRMIVIEDGDLPP